MNRYSLTFKNAVIEGKYQQTSILEIRMTMFTLITLGFVVVFLVRIGQGLIQQNYLNVATYVAMITYFALQYALTKKYKSLLRCSLILLNHVFTIYFLFVEESTDSLSAHLRGVNQMGSNFLIILAGEYIDAMFSLISISIIRIAIIFYKSTNIEYSAVGSAIIMIIYASRYLYQYHKAIRSQYLLTLVQESWENILSQVNKRVPYMQLYFEEEKLKFTHSTSMNVNYLFSTDEEASNFLRESSINQISFEQLIYNEIKQYQKQRIDLLNKSITISYRKKLIQVEYSVYFGNKPTILIIFSQAQAQSLKCEPEILKKYHLYLDLIILLLGKFQENKNNLIQQLKNIRRKILLTKLIDKISRNQFKCKQICMSKFFHSLTKLYHEHKIILMSNSPTLIHTILSILHFFFASTMESLLSDKLTIRQTANSKYEFTLSGLFQDQELKRISKTLSYQYDLIFEKLEISEEKILFSLYPQTFVPFSLNSQL